VKRLRRLLSRRRARDAERAFVVEGTTFVDEALDAGVELEAIFVTAGAADPTVERAAALMRVIHSRRKSRLRLRRSR